MSAENLEISLLPLSLLGWVEVERPGKAHAHKQTHQHTDRHTDTHTDTDTDMHAKKKISQLMEGVWSIKCHSYMLLSQRSEEMRTYSH